MKDLQHAFETAVIQDVLQSNHCNIAKVSSSSISNSRRVCNARHPGAALPQSSDDGTQASPYAKLHPRHSYRARYDQHVETSLGFSS